MNSNELGERIFQLLRVNSGDKVTISKDKVNDCNLLLSIQRGEHK